MICAVASRWKCWNTGTTWSKCALLGHARIDTTQIYTMIRPAQLKQAVSFYEESARQMMASFRSDKNSMFEEHSYVPQTRSLKLQ
jgi:hypothetical protein